MDNTKTGALIRELRREVGMTQRELASLLHITDRAVSKWERGLSAPDIALLEPLSEALGVTITELIRGERAETPEPQDDVKRVLEFSESEVMRKVRRTRQRYLTILAACLMLAAMIGAIVLWRSGVLFVLDRRTSPDGRHTIVVYDRELDFPLVAKENAISTIVRHPDGGSTRMSYLWAAYYDGAWWSPDSQKYVIALRYPDSGIWLSLVSFETNSEIALNHVLPADMEARANCEVHFLQWGADSESMLFYYAFEDAGHVTREGYFWYNWRTNEVHGVFELPPAA